MDIIILIVGIIILVLCGVLRAFAGRDWKLDRGDRWGKSYQEEWGFGNGRQDEQSD